MIRRLGTALAALVFVAACGGDGEPAAIPTKVDPALAPGQLLDGALKLFENTDDTTRTAFADAGDTSLMADGRLWEIRRAERLVGTLQITTLQPRVDLTDEKQRDAIIRDILVGESTSIRVGDVEVSEITVGDRAIYVWFGSDLVEVLTVKGFDDIDPEQVLDDLVDHQATVASWDPLPLEGEEDDA